MDKSEEKPEIYYSHVDFFYLFESKYRILIWNVINIIVNLTKIDTDNKFELFFDKYYSLLENDFMIRVTNVVSNSSKKRIAKSYLTEKVTNKLLTVQYIKITPHLSDECKRVITEYTIKSFDRFFTQIKQKEKVISFVKKKI